jgi:uncharacterized repeat protein (TIGR01451 family)
MRKALIVLPMVLGIAGLSLLSACSGGEQEPEGENGSAFGETVRAERTTATPSPSGMAVPRSPTPSATASQGADVFVTKLDSPDPVVSGEEITYTLLVVNSGSVTATDVRVDDDLPSGSVFVSASPGCSEGATVSCGIGKLGPGDTHRLTITVAAPAVTSQTSIKNCAVAYADNDQNTDNNDHCQSTSVGPAPAEATPTQATSEPVRSPTRGSATPESPTQPPTSSCRPAPSDLTANMHWSGGAAWVDLLWTDNSGDEDGFRVERAISADGPYSVIATLGSSATAWTDDTLAYGPESYYYRLIAYGLRCDSGQSNIASVTGRWPMPTSPPSCADVGAPSGLMVARQYPLDGRYFIDLQWQDNSTTEAGFLVQRASVSEGPWGNAASVGPDILRFTDEPPVGPSPWYYRVLALGAGPCYSVPSNIVASVQ